MSFIGARVRGRVITGAVLGALASTACASKDPTPAASTAPPQCLPAAANADCTDPLYNPTFANVFQTTLSMKCAVAGCHVPPAPQAGLELDQIDTAYAALTQQGADIVNAGDVTCGHLIVRLETPGETWSMPKGNDQLSEPERCAIRQWIKNGAKR
jgi:hypothetical protein